MIRVVLPYHLKTLAGIRGEVPLEVAEPVTVSAVLDALTALLHDRARERATQGDDDGARRAAMAVRAVEKAKFRASGNVNPQLIGSALLREFVELRP